jgi:hypothetical protein
MNSREEAALFLTAALTAVLLAQLIRLGLFPIHRFFFWFLAADLTSTLGALSMYGNTNLYALVYLALQTVKIAVAAFAVLELCRLALEGQPALARFSRAVAAYALAGAAVIPVVSIVWTLPGPASFPVLRAFFSFEQTMSATITVFLALTLLFVIWFPVRVPRNAALIMVGFAAWSFSRWFYVYCVSHALGNRRLIDAAGAGQMAVVFGCLLFWIAGLRRADERGTVLAGRRAEAVRLNTQLEAINNHLSRVVQAFTR